MICAGMFDYHNLNHGHVTVRDENYYQIEFGCRWYDSTIAHMGITERAAFLAKWKIDKTNPNMLEPDQKTCMEYTSLPTKKNDWNDRVSSFFVMPGCELKLYEHADSYAQNSWKESGNGMERAEHRERHQIGGTYHTGTVWNLVGQYDNIVSAFKCTCTIDAWLDVWSVAQRQLEEEANQDRRRTGSVSEPLEELHQATQKDTTWHLTTDDAWHLTTESSAPNFNLGDPTTWGQKCLSDSMEPVPCDEEESNSSE